jgi:hypothetical protein
MNERTSIYEFIMENTFTLKDSNQTHFKLLYEHKSIDDKYIGWLDDNFSRALKLGSK